MRGRHTIEVAYVNTSCSVIRTDSSSDMLMLVGLHLTHMRDKINTCVTQQWIESSVLLDEFVAEHVSVTLNLTGCRKAAELCDWLVCMFPALTGFEDVSA